MLTCNFQENRRSDTYQQESQKLCYYLQQQLFASAPNEAFVILLYQVTELVIVTLFHLTLTVFCDNEQPKLLNSYFANIFLILAYPRILHCESRCNKKL